MPAPSDISADGVYLLDGVLELVLWVGAHASPAFKVALFGSADIRDGAELRGASDSEEAAKLHAMLEEVRARDPASEPPLRVVVQGSPESARFFSRLLADGYEPFVLSMHDERVRPKL